MNVSLLNLNRYHALKMTFTGGGKKEHLVSMALSVHITDEEGCCSRVLLPGNQFEFLIASASAQPAHKN